MGRCGLTFPCFNRRTKRKVPKCPPSRDLARAVSCYREAAVAFVLDWKADHNKNDLSATPSNPDAAVLPSGTMNDRGNHGSKAMMAKIPEGDGDGGDAAFAAKRAARAREMERKQLKEGREALMRLGIFLERHEVQEDTVDVLSCAGWI